MIVSMSRIVRSAAPGDALLAARSATTTFPSPVRRTGLDLVVSTSIAGIMTQSLQQTSRR